MMNEQTTNLEVVRQRPALFVWGKVTAIRDVGRYTIVESIHRETHEVSFHIYVDGKHSHHSASTLDGALVIAIAFGQFENKNVAAERGRCAAVLLGVQE